MRFWIAVLLLTTIALASCIRTPTWSAPAIAFPGQTFQLNATSNVIQVKADNGHFSFTLKVIGEGNSVKVEVPKGAKPGLYDLIVKTASGECYQHHALWIPKEVPKRLVIFHLTDEHFGVFNPTGRKASQYVLAAVIIANSDPNVTLVAVTGDVADTAMPQQYQEAKLIHGLLRVPVLMVPGNHDHVSAEDTYSEYAGPKTWYRKLGDFLIVGLDTGAEGYLSYPQAKWASQILSQNAKVKIVMFHHPLFAYVYGDIPHSFNVSSWEELYKVLLSKKPGSKYTYLYRSWLGDVAGLKEFLKAIYNDNVTLTLSGHIHLDSYAVIERPNGVKTWFVTTTTTGGPIREGDYHGFKIVIVSPNFVKTEGLGEPWSRHASYSLEGALANLGMNENASAVTFELKDKRLLKLMPHLVLAVPVPKSFKNNFDIYAPGFQKVWRDCTQAFCVVYAETNDVRLNKVYRLAAYVKPDNSPPVIEDVEYPSKIRVGEPLTISFQSYDSGWGLDKVQVIVKTPSYQLNVTPVNYGYGYKVTLPPIKEPGKANVTIVAEDFYGHKTSKSFSVEVMKPVKVVHKPHPQAHERISPIAYIIAASTILAIAAILVFFFG